MNERGEFDCSVDNDRALIELFIICEISNPTEVFIQFCLFQQENNSESLQILLSSSKYLLK